MTFLKDTDGDGKADHKETVLTGFGCEDSHHALHDFAWTPDGDLIFRESIFHHTQVETPYGPVRQQNSGWFAWEPKLHRLTAFGTHASTNPWGVTFDDWGQTLPVIRSSPPLTMPLTPLSGAAPQALGHASLFRGLRTGVHRLSQLAQGPTRKHGQSTLQVDQPGGNPEVE